MRGSDDLIRIDGQSRFILDASARGAFPFATIYSLGAWLPIMLLNGMYGHRMASYLRSHHQEKWSEMVGRPTMLLWLYNRGADFDDPAVANLKQQNREFLRLVLTVFLTFPIVWLLL